MMRAARGTGAAPAGLQAADPIGTVAWRGYESTTPGYTTAVARISANALESFTATAQGTEIEFIAVLPGTTVLPAAPLMRIGPGLTVGSPTAPTGAAMATGDLNVAGRVMINGVSVGGGSGLDTQSLGLTALGQTLTSQYNSFTTVGAGGACALPTGMSSGDHCKINNRGANDLTVTPGGGVAINTQATGVAMIIPVNTTAYFHRESSTQWVTIP
jgi:hypothetical protein